MMTVSRPGSGKAPIFGLQSARRAGGRINTLQMLLLRGLYGKNSRYAVG
jgi:hypothetical protein